MARSRAPWRASSSANAPRSDTSRQSQSRAASPRPSIFQRRPGRAWRPTASTPRDPLRKLAPADLRKADIIVIFNPLPVKLAIRPTRDWVATPSVNDDYPNARLEIDRRIDALLDEIAKLPGKK